MNSGGFFAKVYAAVKQIPAGSVATYGQIAMLCESPRASRAVGWALHRNPQPVVIPCHRVVDRNGRLAPEFAFGGSEEQRRLLENEGITFLENGNVDLKKHIWHIDFIFPEDTQKENREP